MEQPWLLLIHQLPSKPASPGEDLMARTEILRAKTGHVLDIGAALAVILLGVWPLIRR
ncbi:MULTISPECIES: hypothetical protein [unclassified Mesorhizobium]|uniref:hypothetical protein n=1 Tax=unclassified Mesorhizobium TaxID=325217 RepID=UPI00333A6833